MLYLRKYIFLHSVTVNKKVLEYTIYSVETIKIQIRARSIFYLSKLVKSYITIKKCDIAEKNIFLYSTHINEIVLEWAIYPRKTIRDRFGYGLYSTQKNPTKPIKKTSRGTLSMNKWTKFGEYWNIFRYRNGNTFVFLTDSRIHKHFSHCKFRNPEGLKSLQKKFRSFEGFFLEFGYCNTSFGCIKILYWSYYISSP